MAADIITRLDRKWGLWQKEDETKSDSQKAADEDEDQKPDLEALKEGEKIGQRQLGMKSANPMLHNITEYLVEEGSFEEEALLGGELEDVARKESDSGDIKIQRDEDLLKVLDRLILYLRIVHKVDFYSGMDFPYEDDMPNRVGIIHIRGTPLAKEPYTTADVANQMSVQEGKLQHLIKIRSHIPAKEAADLGKKDDEAEVEKFIQANCKKLAEEKYLCPLSNKKFKSSEFVRKHIFNKHSARLDDVKKDVAYFNNYLLDPQRSMLPEHPKTAQGHSAAAGGGGGGGGANPMMPPLMPYPPFMPRPPYGMPPFYPPYFPPPGGWPPFAGGGNAPGGQGGPPSNVPPALPRSAAAGPPPATGAPPPQHSPIAVAPAPMSAPQQAPPQRAPPPRPPPSNNFGRPTYSGGRGGWGGSREREMTSYVDLDEPGGSDVFS